jgi:hypothetical protein
VKRIRYALQPMLTRVSFVQRKPGKASRVDMAGTSMGWCGCAALSIPAKISGAALSAGTDGPYSGYRFRAFCLPETSRSPAARLEPSDQPRLALHGCHHLVPGGDLARPLPPGGAALVSSAPRNVGRHRGWRPVRQSGDNIALDVAPHTVEMIKIRGAIVSACVFVLVATS